MRQQALIGALFVGASVHAAGAVPSQDGDLKSAVSGKTVTIQTPLGLPITVNYGANGMMTGTAGTALGVYLGAQKDRGRWQVRNGKLCQKWFKWLSGDTTCLTFRQEGQKIYWQSDEGQTGTAMIEAGPPAFDGITASGLGLPQPPSVAVARTPPPAPEPESRTSEPPSPQSSRSATVPPTPAGSRKPIEKPVVAPAEPELIERPREAVRPTRLVAAGTAPRFALASFAPIVPPTWSQPQPSEPVHVEPEATSDATEAEARSMRHAADAAAIAAMEHRWCLSNAFAKGPALPFHAATFASPELVSAPSLFAVAQEQIYDGELPLHESSCLTEEPAIGIAARMSEAR
jgi:hypothetical protein